MVEYKDAAPEEGDNNSPCFRAMVDGFQPCHKSQESSWRMRTCNNSIRINGHTIMKETVNENDPGRLVDGEAPVREVVRPCG
ncbi:hypothetical protein TNIN_81361 [Trichonephila inaurata madagascariensis]|uniref:Uncharacterized protein n=1 Tax=Trichonephila inaurata madagascariensis TaxID=2747483 RepID=A0A8X6XZE0_9ARAC|nr:hypothetical protein TNIN_81361 [Trichonephila inaurata madagascariensis]